MSSTVMQSGHWHPASRPDDELETEVHLPYDPNPELDNGLSNFTLDLALNHGSDESHGATEFMQNAPATANEPPETPLPPFPKPGLIRQSSLTSGTIKDEEMPDDDDEERFDPAWGFSRTNTEQFLASANRSTTFPPFVPFVPNSESTPVLGQEELLEKPEAEKPPEIMAHGHEMNAQAYAPSGPGETRAQTDEHLQGVMGQSNLENPLADLDDPSEARYEEGIPLMSPEDSNVQDQDHGPPPEIPTRAVAFADDDDEETSFFNHVDQSAEKKNNVAPTLERKSTSVVIGTVAVKPPEEIESWNAQPDISDAFNAGDDAGDGIGFFSKVADAQEPEKNDAVDDPWKAMVDEDDEFLVEDPDDLLPDTDSDPGSPSSFNAMLQEALPEEPTNVASPIQGNAFNTQTTPPSARRPAFPQRGSSSNPYAPHQPSSSELSQLSPTTYGNVGLSRPGLAPLNSFQSHLQHRPSPSQPSESFADQSKGGYKSPYDLPMELSKPRKRAQLPQLAPTTKAVPPPPRSSSMTDKQLQSPFTPTAPGFPPSSMAPPIQTPQQGSRSMTASVPAPTGPKTKASTSSFFEELPISSKPRPVSGQARYTPQQTNVPPVPQLLPQSSPPQKALPPHPQPSPSRQADPYAQFQLRQPERLDPFSNTPLQPPSAPLIPSAPAASNSRYSPAPPNLPNLPRTGPSPRYSPAPLPQSSGPAAVNRYASQSHISQPGQPQQPLENRYVSQPPLTQPPGPQFPFAPRTSSPLVHHKASIDAGSTVPPPHAVTQVPPHQQHLYQSRTSSPPPLAATYGSPNKVPAPPAALAPPRRSQTQSPSKQRPRPTIAMPSIDALNRPASAHGQMSPVRAQAQMDTALPPRPRVQARGIAEELEFIQPADETSADALQRWKGAPVFHFGFGGTIVTTFPKHIPRYAQGSVRPQIKPTFGDVSVRNLKDVLPLSDHMSSFPGPLRNKSKKKDVLNWLNVSIARLESEAPTLSPMTQMVPDPRKRHEEKVLLWKLLRSLVDHDGILETSPDAMKSVNAVLAPEVHAVDEATATQYRAEDVASGIYRPSGSNVKSDVVDPMAMETLRKHLLRGGRQEAVWHAVDHRLWSHALLIASTLPPDVWGQVVHEFVKQEVKTAGANTESLSTLYEIFGGNKDDCVDQLVPPSARAGLQMVSKVENSGPTKNALGGLDRWRETLTLVINNRSQGDHQALATLGRLLADYGRIEAAHICFLFSRNPANSVIVGGSDDPQASITLLGADNRKQPYDFARDQEAILLTEVYEFATLVLGGNSVMPFLPYLSPYKLQHAVLLAENGFKIEAQTYCDALMASVNRSTKTLPYYHRVFLGELDDFQNRLKQVPIQTSGSWTKPNLEKVSNSLLGRLSSFVAGDDSDAESKGSGKDAAEAGPFANVAGTPSLSRSGSQSDIYGSYPSTAAATIPNTIAGSRYAPNGINSTRSSSELTRGRPSLDFQRSPPQSSHARSPYDPVNMLQQTRDSPPVNPYQSFGASPPTSRYQATPPQSSYMPHAAASSAPIPPVQEAYIPTPPPEEQHQPQQTYEPAIPGVSEYASSPYEQPSFSGFVPSTLTQPNDSTASEPTAQSFGYGYEPPSDSGYVPYTPEPDSPEQPRPKKKSFMDDDDDFPRPSNPTPATSLSGPPPPPSAPSGAVKAAPSASGVDPAIAAAVAEQEEREREAKQAKDAAKKNAGWFGGLWGGKKNESLDAAPANKGGAEPKVYKANLGESKMKLYYDKDLKKWVNPDNPDAGVKTATPPPPRAVSAVGGPPRAVASTAVLPMGPPTSSSPAPLSAPGGSPMLGSGPPSRQGTPADSHASVLGTLPPATQAGLGIGPSPGASGPPSRPGTAMSNASSIDDLLGAGPPGGGRKSMKGKKGGKGGRYIDVMAK